MRDNLTTPSKNYMFQASWEKNWQAKEKEKKNGSTKSKDREMEAPQCW